MMGVPGPKELPQYMHPIVGGSFRAIIFTIGPRDKAVDVIGCKIPLQKASNWCASHVSSTQSWKSSARQRGCVAVCCAVFCFLLL